jgi:hypothetical protein
MCGYLQQEKRSELGQPEKEGGSIVTESELLPRVIRYMVENARGDYFHGSPRHFMESSGYSSGRLYGRLEELGIHCIKHGPQGVWYIPPDVRDRFRRAS